jgi:hypothetical protein
VIVRTATAFFFTNSSVVLSDSRLAPNPRKYGSALDQLRNRMEGNVLVSPSSPLIPIGVPTLPAQTDTPATGNHDGFIVQGIVDAPERG